MASSAGKQRTQEERRSRAERSMLAAAVRLFSRRGVEQTSMADIGEEAGYSRGLANHHFGSRAELVERLARRSQAEFVTSLGDTGGEELRELAERFGIGVETGERPGITQDLVDRLDARPPSALLKDLGDFGGVELRALVALADAYLATIGGGSDAVRAFLVMWGASFPEETALRLVFAANDARFRRSVEELVRLGQLNGNLDPGADPAGTATVVVGLLRGISAQYTVDPGGVDLDAARRTTARFLRDTLGVA
ncbi:TetR/AcrR family transcriptional regulator [Amycolatopsis magusensis]|uniref:TetR/AcrR family transcriptional regulator n=1 Tax=Amycolatopsis magusensis TaxID=882444 RepID=UPI0024A95D97|nr:TetR/AcrR family transcriptional regulator [Amycolatopsis magusensis]MDI5975637.1 TetR/AcrR family transcriptional regulator [Amycolatopsis magusensis]